LKKLFVLISVLASLHSISQIGGSRSYRFLDIPMTARAAGAGGTSMAFWDDDINLLHSNPAALNPSMSRQLAMNYCNFVSDLNFGYLAYAHDLKQYGTVAGSIQFYDYGQFTGYDEMGQPTGSFKANDYSLNLNYGRPIGRDSSFNIGIALKTIISQYDVYQSMGNAIDFGIMYHKRNFAASLLARNVGYMWKNYSNTSSQSEPLPRNVQLGLSYKLSKAPFRLFLVYDNLVTWNLKYINPVDTAGQSDPFNTTRKDSSDWQRFKKRAGNRVDNLMRHVTFGTEIVLSKNFSLRVAYNYRRQREMTIPDRRGANGLSFGFSLRVKRFGFSYSFSKMAFPGNSHVFGITARL
jgi:hypothetical protein